MSDSKSSSFPAVPGVIQALAWLAALELTACGAIQWYRAGSPRGLWLQTGLLLLMAAGALARKKTARPDAADNLSNDQPGHAAALLERVPAWILALLVAVVALSAAAWQQAGAADLPPGIHDEYSYLFQAQTFLAGRLWFPSHPVMPELFDQIHVLNEGKFASRYFPGTALWLAPFLAAGVPHAAYSVAAAIVAALVYGTGHVLGGRGVGLAAGLLAALSPAMVVFGDTLLSHHPTLVGLMLFVFGVARCSARPETLHGLLAGAGLGFGLLCRPLTAAAFALPVAAWLAGWLMRSAASRDGASARRAARVAAAMAAPALVALAAMGAYNQQITGSAWKLPYEQYNELYTPSQRFGFNNAVKGAAAHCPQRIEEYDRWAYNLTFDLAVSNLRTRLIEGWRSMLGIAPLSLAGAACCLMWPWLPAPWRMALGMIAALHAAYFPYWFSGISGFHYVFESGPVWALLVAGAGSGMMRAWRQAGLWLMPACWLLLVAGTLASAYVPLSTEEKPLIDQMAAGFRSMRWRHGEFRKLVEEKVAQRPALVLVQQPPPNIHIDFVVNHPALQAEVLVGRYAPERHALSEIAAAFPDRAVYLFRERDWVIERAQP